VDVAHIAEAADALTGAAPRMTVRAR